MIPQLEITKVTVGGTYPSDFKRYSQVLDGIEFKAHTETELSDLIHEHKMSTNPEYNKRYTDEVNTPLNIRTVTTKNYDFGCISLVGIGGTPPHRRGNYFTMYVDGVEYPVVNTWYENLKDALKRFNVNELTFEIFNDNCCRIISDKIDPKWLMSPFLSYNLRRGLGRGTKEQIIKHCEGN